MAKMKPKAVALLVCLLVAQQILALEIDPTTRQHSANDPADWSAAITVSPGPGEENWTANVIPEFAGDDVSWVSITPVQPSFLVYALNENFAAEVRTALIDFGAGVPLLVFLSQQPFSAGKGSYIYAPANSIRMTSDLCRKDKI